MTRPAWPSLALCLCLAAVGCSDEPDRDPTMVDSGTPPDDAGAGPTAHCQYMPTEPTAGAGGTVTAAPLEAAAAEAPIELPVGSTLGAYGDRATSLNPGIEVDERTMELAGTFAPSVGVETLPMAKAVVLRAGDETVVLLKVDLGVGFESLTWDVADALGSEFHGKVLIANSHSHGAYGHYTNDFAMQVAFGQYRGFSYRRLRDQLVSLAEQAVADLQPARIGFAHDGAFDPTDLVNRDRRGENDDLLGGPRDDEDLFVIRVDAEPSGDPIAMIPVIGLHGTIMGGENLMITTDAPGAIARSLQETFDQEVVVMHLQGAAGDVSPAGTAGIDCDGLDRCYNFARAETVGHYAEDMILPVYEQAGMNMQTSIALEMLTRSIPLGPDHENFAVRDGELEYIAWDGESFPDGQIYDMNGDILSPLDEFNAPNGAALCANGGISLPISPIPGVLGVPPYESCLSVGDLATETLANLFSFEPQQAPLCYSTRTTISALRLGDYLVAGAPGEVVTLWADTLREASPRDPDKTIIVGYANDNIGYLLTPEDWLSGGYEPSINFWGPLEGQLILERTAELLEMADTDAREDGTQMGDNRMIAPEEGINEPLPPPDPAPMAGTVPGSLPATLFIRQGQQGVTLTSAQPQDIGRLESTHFVWIGEDPMTATPVVTLQRQVGGAWEDVQRRSGRPVQDRDVLLTWTPDPLQRDGTNPRTHYWVAEWQAVTPVGTPGLTRIEDRPGVPLGTYRFHVAGQGDSGAYEVTSDPFTVSEATLEVTAGIDSTTGDLVVNASYHAPQGYRLLSFDVRSNRPVPVYEGETVTVDLNGGMNPAPTQETVGAGGEIRVAVTGGTPSSVTVTDQFGNTGTATVP